ncbi:hypothetical protein EE612_049685, partial [Oryza sativa]
AGASGFVITARVRHCQSTAATASSSSDDVVHQPRRDGHVVEGKVWYLVPVC